MHISLVACVKRPSALLGSIYVVNVCGPQEGRTIQTSYCPQILPNLSPTEIALSSASVRTRASLCVMTSIGLSILR